LVSDDGFVWDEGELVLTMNAGYREFFHHRHHFIYIR
jgi:hypothetical protein